MVFEKMSLNSLKILFIVISAMILTSCKAYDVSMLKITADPINPKLPALKMVYGNFSISVSYGDPCRCELNMLSDEVEYNLTEFYGEHFGYISFQIQMVDYGTGDAFLFPTIFSLGILNLLGVPARSYMKEIELKVTIMDSNRQLLKKYSSRGKSRVWVAYYYGYRDKYASLMMHSLALNSALLEVRKEIQGDAEELREKLLSAGSIKGD